MTRRFDFASLARPDAMVPTPRCASRPRVRGLHQHLHQWITARKRCWRTTPSIPIASSDRALLQEEEAGGTTDNTLGQLASRTPVSRAALTGSGTCSRSRLIGEGAEGLRNSTCSWGDVMDGGVVGGRPRPPRRAGWLLASTRRLRRVSREYRSRRTRSGLHRR